LLDEIGFGGFGRMSHTEPRMGEPILFSMSASQESDA
jgi:hypothetical protein